MYWRKAIEFRGRAAVAAAPSVRSALSDATIVSDDAPFRWGRCSLNWSAKSEVVRTTDRSASRAISVVLPNWRCSRVGDGAGTGTIPA